MSETKKVAFSTLGPIKKDKKKVKDVKSMRIVLTLPESNEKSCPEFNYREMVTQKLHERIGKKNLGDVINGPSLDPSDPFASDEDAALKALAKKLENKYGGYTSGTKKKRRKENDFKTLGEGYDETDPFIDNSDAFDEVVPTHLETKHRGFYINSGELDFERVAAEGDEEPELTEESSHSEKEVRRKKRMNQIQSDDDENSEEDEEEEENQDSEDEDGNIKKRKLHENGFIRHKKRKLDEGELLRKRKKMIGKFNAKNLEKKDSDQESERPVSSAENKGEVQQSEQSTVKASIEAVVSKAREEAGEKKEESEESASSSSNSSSSDSDSSGSSSSSESESDEEADGEGEEEVENEDVNEDDGEEQEAPGLGDDHRVSDNEDNIPLPDNLPPDLIQVISKLKEEGHSSKLSSQKFFTDSVNKLLLSIEMKLNKYGGRKKTQIYNHLSQHLPCGTQTIVKRAKNLLSERHESRLREPLKRLKEAVDAELPSLVEQHALECQKAAESKGENGVAQNDDDESEDGDKKKSRLPKKKFTFTEEIRKLVCEVVRVRVTFWQMIKKRSETPEDYIRTFLETEVRPIWPKGWMNVRILYKESYAAHACITDKNYVKPTSTKKQHILGGGSVTPSFTPTPPRPSLSATVIPKVQSSSSPKPASSSTKLLPICSSKPSLSSSTTARPSPPPVSSAKIQSSSISSCPSSGKLKEPPPRKKSITGDTKESGKKPDDRNSTNVGLSIRSVEKINEGAPKTSGNELEKESEKASSSTVVNSEKSNVKDSLITETKSKVESVSVIDLSSDEDKTVVNKVSSSNVTKDTIKSNDMKNRHISEKDTSPVSSTTSVMQTANSTIVEGKKDDNLEEEMNSVMNELLQISKQKSVDDTSEKIRPKDHFEGSSVSSTSKPQQASQSQEQSPKNHQKHESQSALLSRKHHSISPQHKPPHHISLDNPSSQNNHHSHSSSLGDHTKYTSSGKSDRSSSLGDHTKYISSGKSDRSSALGDHTKYTSSGKSDRSSHGDHTKYTSSGKSDRSSLDHTKYISSGTSKSERPSELDHTKFTSSGKSDRSSLDHSKYTSSGKSDRSSLDHSKYTSSGKSDRSSLDHTKYTSSSKSDRSSALDHTKYTSSGKSEKSSSHGDHTKYTSSGKSDRSSSHGDHTKYTSSGKSDRSSSLGDHTKYTSSSKSDRQALEQQSSIHLHKHSSSQYHTSSEQQKHSTNIHSPDKHERQTMQQCSSMQPNSPATTHHQPISLSAHNHPHQTQQQKLSMQQSQPQQQPLNLQQTKSQQPLNLQQTKSQQPHQQPLNLQQTKTQQPQHYHQSKSHYQTPLPKHSPTSAEPSHPKKSSQHHQHQSSNHPKPVGMSSSQWSPSDVSVIPQISPTGMNKMSSSWATGHDVSPSKHQRQHESPIVSSSDPLANLRLMHGLSVSSIGKKASAASTSVYHTPAALATSSIISYTNPGSKKSSNDGNSTTQNAVTPGGSGLSSTHSYPSKTHSSSTTLHSSSKVSSAVHSSYSTTSASSSSKFASNTTKPRLDSFTGSLNQSIYAGLTPEQQQLLYEQLKQQQLQSNTLTAHQQQELWQQMRSAGFLPGMSGMSNTDMLKLITQMGKSIDSYSSSAQPGQRHGQF